MKVLFPRVHGKALTGVIINTAGGMTGGDRFDVSANAAPGCNLVLTTQAAERVYRARTGEVANLNNCLSVGDQARLNWLPQETILYNRSALRRSLTIDLSGNGSVLAVEPLIFGRMEMGEVLGNISFRDRVEIRRDGQLIFADRTMLEGNAAHHLTGPATGGDCGAMASLVLATGDAEQYLDPVRSLLPETGGVSLIRDGLLFARVLAKDGFILRQTLLPLIEMLSATAIPRTWMT